MDLLTRDLIDGLVGVDPSPSVSLFQPTHRNGPGTTPEDRATFRNLVAEAERELSSLGLRKPDVDAVLAGVRALDANAFWAHQADGLAVFARAGEVTELRLPRSFDPLVIVAERFHVKPLLPLLGEHRYALLALARDDTRLFTGGQLGLGQVRLGDAPTSVAEAVRFDDREKQQQSRSVGRAAIFHGHGAELDSKDQLMRFLRALDAGVAEVLRGERIPLVLAGVEEVVARYRQVCSYPHVLADAVIGSPAHLDATALHDRAWPIVEAAAAKERGAHSDRYREALAAGRTVEGVIETVAAARSGRLDSVWVPVGTQVWGRYLDGTCEVHEQRLPGDIDLLDAAAINGWRSGAAIHAVDSDELPGESLTCGVLRY